MLNPFLFFRTFFSLLASAGWVLLTLLVVFFALAATLYFSEIEPHISGAPDGWWESLYLSAITALTVGYGDVSPKSPIGRLVAVGLGFLGILLTGIVVAAAIKALEKASGKLNGK